MSLTMVEAALADFLSSSEPRVVALSGQWGLGKTYYWRHFFERRASTLATPCDYSYVSLFGIPDLPSFKDALFDHAVRPRQASTATVPGSAGSDRAIAPPGPGDVRAILGQFASRLYGGARRHMNLLERAPGLKEVGPFLRSAAFLTVAGYVVCIDDIERHSDGLPLKDVLGLVSMLREQRGCRVLVILNTDALLEADRAEYERFREKVFDYEIAFDPSPSDCASLVFDQSKEHHRLASQHAVALEIRNIRVLLRISRLIEALYPHVADLDHMVLEQMVHSVVLLTWSFNTHDSETPSFEYLKHLNYGSSMELKGIRELTAEQKNWNALLSRYDYRNSDDLDLAICASLERGFLDEEKVRLAVADRHGAAIRARLEKRYEAAWDIYHGGFGDDTLQLVEAFRTSMKAAARWVSALNASATVGLLRDVGHEDVADELMDFWIDVQAKDNAAALDMDDSPFASDIKDRKFREAMSRASRSTKEEPTLEEVVRSLPRKNGWNPTDESVLLAASEQDYFDVFKRLSGSGTRACVRVCLRFGDYANASSEHRAIADKARRALLRIAAEHPLNARRVSGLGIDLTEAESSQSQSPAVSPAPSSADPAPEGKM